VYWAYHTPHNVVRGKHAHKELKQVLFAVSGIIRVELENERGALSDFILDNPSVGLYIPEMHWRTIKFSHNAVMMCLASMEYRENDYIRNYADFKSLCKDLGY
jgi:dTDP-4-dehydrorhamnose 3,5-epimerase-like enzyme